MTRDVTIHEIAGVSALDHAERTFPMTEEAFHIFYGQTSRPLWLYLARATGDSRLADDLLQEAYYRLLRAGTAFESEDHRRHYLFRIATNLVRDERRRPRMELQGGGKERVAAVDGDRAERTARRLDLLKAMAQLKPRERSLLWLAYAQGCSHQEIAQALGLKTASMKALLHRARRRLAAILGGR